MTSIRLPLPRFARRPWFFVALAAIHLYLGGDHLIDLFGGALTWTHVWKGFGAVAGVYYFVALAQRGPAVALALVLALPLAACSGAVRGAPPPPERNRITHGPILGRVGAHAIGIWARTAEPGSFLVHHGTAPGRLDAVSPPVETALERDNTGWVLLSGLRADTKHWYEVRVPGAATGPGGTFRTLPDPAEARNDPHNPRGLFNVRFEFGCGNDARPHLGRDPALRTFRTALDRHADRIDFAILNGDWLYEEAREHTVEAWLREVRRTSGEAPDLVRVAPRIVGVWENYKVFLGRSPNLAEWHRRVPSYFTYDDHEILNDVYGTATVGLRDRRAVFRDIGVQAWYDYLGWSNPVEAPQAIRFGRARLDAGSDVLVDERADFGTVDLARIGTLMVHWGDGREGVDDNALDGRGGDPNAGVYEVVERLDRTRLRIRPAARATGAASYSIGRRSWFRVRVANAELFFLDTRGHRDLHDVKQPDRPGVSMIGRAQREWLMEGMRASDADFLFVVSSVNFTVPHVGGGAVRAANKEEAWTGFLHEREQLIRFWESLGRPVFVLTGDLHNSFVARVSDRVWELASGPHNSQSHLLRDEGDRPPNGPFTFGGRTVELRWSTFHVNDVPRDVLTRPGLRHPVYAIVQVNNVYDNPRRPGERRLVAYPRPHVVAQFYSGDTGELLYAESVPR